MGRLEGIDLARALAFVGMLLAHFAFPLRPGEPGWVEAIDASADGRAAPLFCVLLGLGSGLLIAHGATDRVLVLRGAVLFAVGLAIWPYVGFVYLILPHYGLLLALVPLLRRLPKWALLPAAAIAFLVPSIVTGLMDGHGLRGSPQPGTYEQLFDLPELLRNLLWTGGYPLIGWVGFVLVGLWLSRLRLDRRRVQVALLLGGGAIAAVQPVIAWVATELGGIRERADAGGWASFFDAAAHSNRTAWYVLSSATAAAIIGGCLLLVDLVPGRWKVPFVRLGQLALTVYLIHLFIGTNWVWPWLEDQRPAYLLQLLVLGIVLLGLTAFATAWRWRLRRGPAEAALRAIAG